MNWTSLPSSWSHCCAMIGARSLLLLVGILRAVRAQVKVDAKVLARVGSNVVLRCSVESSNLPVTQVTWKRNENGQKVDFLTKSESGVKKLTQFAKDRVEFLGSESKDGSIEIKNVTLSDESVYICIFTLFPAGDDENTITLTVQVPPDIHAEPSPDPAVAKLPYQTVAICVAGAAKPAANITWKTGELDYKSSDNEIKHSNRTVTTESQLRMIPGAGIKDRSVTCVISQNYGISQTREERTLTIQDVQYPPDSVHVEVRRLNSKTVQFICVEDSSPPATNFSWRRKDTYDSNIMVELGNERILSSDHFPSGYYICEVTNPIGKSSGYLYVYHPPDSSACLHGCLWPWLILILALGFLCLRWYRRQGVKMNAGTEWRPAKKEETSEP